jgi:outer membrane protein assembly factor BamE (lipoprotein component of BamABCDE complex)
MLMLQRCCMILVAASALLASTGCATHDRRDTAYDPKINQGQSLFDQMPNWEYQCGPKGGNRC